MTWYEKYILNAYNSLVKQGKIPDRYYLDPAKIYGEITDDAIYDLMPQEYLNPNNNTMYKVRKSCWDSKYRLTSVDEMKRFLAWDKSVRPPFTSEKDFQDCDDAAVMCWGRVKQWTRGLAFGLLLTNTPAHAKNVFIDVKKDVYEIEPQSNTLVKLYNKTVDQYFF